MATAEETVARLTDAVRQAIASGDQGAARIAMRALDALLCEEQAERAPVP